VQEEVESATAEFKSSGDRRESKTQACRTEKIGYLAAKQNAYVTYSVQWEQLFIGILGERGGEGRREGERKRRGARGGRKGKTGGGRRAKVSNKKRKEICTNLVTCTVNNILCFFSLKITSSSSLEKVNPTLGKRRSKSRRRAKRGINENKTGSSF